jgi:AraC-like DNA-binding protein
MTSGAHVNVADEKVAESGKVARYPRLIKLSQYGVEKYQEILRHRRESLGISYSALEAVTGISDRQLNRLFNEPWDENAVVPEQDYRCLHIVLAPEHSSGRKMLWDEVLDLLYLHPLWFKWDMSHGDYGVVMIKGPRTLADAMWREMRLRGAKTTKDERSVIVEWNRKSNISMGRLEDLLEENLSNPVTPEEVVRLASVIRDMSENYSNVEWLAEIAGFKTSPRKATA